MNDITHKTSTLREAKAEAMVVCNQETLCLVSEKKVPKGDPFEFAKAAAFLGAKKTDQLLPHCHPVTIDGMDIVFTQTAEGIHIEGTAKSIGRTGIEMEILTGVTIAALTLYDMLKPLDKGLQITNIRLVEKKGGKTDREKYFQTPPACALLICSEEIKNGTRKDLVSPLVSQLLAHYKIEQPSCLLVDNEPENIRRAILALIEAGAKCVFTIGGTGLGTRDTTYEAIRSVIEKELDGIVDAMRAHAYARNPLAITSMLIAGNIGASVIVSLPGSEDGAKECLEAILPTLFKVQKMLQKK